MILNQQRPRGIDDAMLGVRRSRRLELLHLLSDLLLLERLVELPGLLNVALELVVRHIVLLEADDGELGVPLLLEQSPLELGLLGHGGDFRGYDAPLLAPQSLILLHEPVVQRAVGLHLEELQHLLVLLD